MQKLAPIDVETLNILLSLTSKDKGMTKDIMIASLTNCVFNTMLRDKPDATEEEKLLWHAQALKYAQARINSLDKQVNHAANYMVDGRTVVKAMLASPPTEGQLKEALAFYEDSLKALKNETN